MLLPISQRNVQPSSLVYTDEWAAYRRIQRALGFNRQTVEWRRWHVESHPNGCFGRLTLDIAEQYPL